MKVSKFVEQTAPGLLELIYPRDLIVPSEYPDPRDISYHICLPIVTACLQTMKSPTARFDNNMMDAYTTAVRLGAQSTPTFLVKESLYHELLTTEFPPETILENIPWPFIGMLFIFPKGLLSSPQEGDCPFLATARFDAGEVIGEESPGWPSMVVGASSFSILSFPIKTENPPMFTGRINFQTNSTFGDISTGSLKEFKYLAATGDRPPPLMAPTTELEFGKFLTEIAAKLVMYMVAHPEKITPGAFKQKVKGREAWTPNYLG